MQPSFGASQDEVRELSFVAALRALDASWWDLRKELDRYLDTYDEYLRLSPQLWQSCRTEKHCDKRETETKRVGWTGCTCGCVPRARAVALKPAAASIGDKLPNDTKETCFPCMRRYSNGKSDKGNEQIFIMTSHRNEVDAHRH